MREIDVGDRHIRLSVFDIPHNLERLKKALFRVLEVSEVMQGERPVVVQSAKPCVLGGEPCAVNFLRPLIERQRAFGLSERLERRRRVQEYGRARDGISKPEFLEERKPAFHTDKRVFALSGFAVKADELARHGKFPAPVFERDSLSLPILEQSSRL